MLNPSCLNLESCVPCPGKTNTKKYEKIKIFKKRLPTIDEDNCNWLTESETNFHYGSKHREKVEVILQYRDGSRKAVKPKQKDKYKAIDDLIWYQINDNQQVSDDWEESHSVRKEETSSNK